MRLALLPTLTVAALLASAAPATAGAGMQVGIADDGVTQRSPQLAPAIVPEWKAVGMDVARVLVVWSYVAPGSKLTERPAGFDPADPSDPQYNWGPIDQVVDLLTAQGIEPILNVTGYIPFWGSLNPSLRRNRYRPDPRQFAVFARAVAARYAGRVRRFILWNEPNLPDWLQPQNTCSSGRCTPSAPHQYRALARLAVPAIKAAAPGAVVYGPALAPRGQSPTARNSKTRPLAFLRALGCVSTKLRRDRSSKPCRGFVPADLDGIAYHPHSGTFAPSRRYSSADDADLADYGKLIRTIDGVQRAGGLLNGGSRTRRFGLFYDEYGYQTNPPDALLGVSLAQQSAWLQWGAYLAYRQPRVKLLIQYLWRDDPINERIDPTKYAGWQSGLYSFDGHPKPARRMFANPFWVDLPRGRRTATVWGQVRPGEAAQVTVQRRTTGKTFTTLRTLTTDAHGFFSFKQIVRARSKLRYRYRGADGRTVTSSTLTVTPTAKR